MNATIRPFYAAHAVQDLFIKCLSVAESAGDISGAEKHWLSAVLLDEPARLAAPVPLHAGQLFLSRHQSRPVLWAGALVLGQDLAPGSEVFVFTLAGKLERFASEAQLCQALEQQLDEPSQQDAVLRFTPVHVRPQLQKAGALTVEFRRLASPVMQGVSQGVSDFLTRCQEETLASLVNMPSLRSVLDTQLGMALALEFKVQALDAHSIQVRSTRIEAMPVQEGDVTTLSLSAVALDFYQKGQLPAGYKRDFLGLPANDSAPVSSASEVQRRMTQVMTLATEHLSSRFQQALHGYWHEAQGARPSLHEYCVARLGDLFFQQGLQALCDGDLTAEQFERLQALGKRNERAQAARLSVFDANIGEVTLTGLFCVFTPGQSTAVFLFGGALGLKKHDTRARLKTWLLSALRVPATFDIVARHAALDQHGFLAGMSQPRLSVENIDHDVFDQCVQSIRATQLRNFNFLLQQWRAGRAVLASIDHGLDVREQVDHGLLALSSKGRWSSRFVSQGNGLTLTHSGNAGQLDLLGLKLPVLQAQLDILLRHWPGPRSFAKARLLESLSRVRHGLLDIDSLVVQAFDQEPEQQTGGPMRSVALVDALLDRVTGNQPLPGNPAHLRPGITSKVSDEIKPLKTFGGTKLLTVLDYAAQDFVARFKQQLHDFLVQPYSALNPDSLLLRLATLRLVMLRAELRLAGHLEPSDSVLLRTVLDYPVSAQRPAIEQFVPEVFAVFLSLSAVSGVINLASCLLFTERGGLESANAGRAIIWTPALGFERFDSLDQCTAQLEARLLDKALRWDLLANVSMGEQPRIVTLLDGTGSWKVPGQNQWFYFEPIEQDFTRHCQRAAMNKLLVDAQFACNLARSTPLSAQGFENSLQSVWRQVSAGVVQNRVAELARLHVFRASLPGWLKNASPADQLDYANLLQRIERAGQANQDYLHDIPDITVYSRSQLKARLSADFPGQALDPDAIEVILHTYIGAPVPVGNTPSFLAAATSVSTQTLTQFALNGFYRLNAGAVFVRAKGDGPLPGALGADYVRQLTRQLNIGAHFQALLKTRLAPGNAGVALRQQQFAEHLWLQVMEQALRERLIDPRCETAYRYLRHVMDRPDGTAREPLNGVAIIIRPLELVADTGREPDRVSGVYLIGPQAPQVGPHILWVNYSTRFSLKTFASEAQVLEQLRTDADLQALVVQRIAPLERKTYAEGGFVEPHLPRFESGSVGSYWPAAGPVTLANRPVAGNLFNEMYKDNYHLLLDMAAQQAKTTQEQDWESLKYLLSLLVETALMFLPGKLSIPLVVWQGLGALSQGVEAARKGAWGESVDEFAVALMLMATQRRQAARTIEVSAQERPPAPGGVMLTPEQEAGLMPFQANEVALVDLHKDPLTQIYRDPHTDLNYVLLAGRVFRVQAWRERWRIYIGEQREGPLVRLGTGQQWVLDLEEPLLGGGPVLSRTIMGTHALAYEMNAIGMDSIQRRFPDKALKIREAHRQASTYLQRCQSALHTLNEPGEQNADNRQYLEDFFDVERVEQDVLERLQAVIEPMQTRFLHPDLSPLTSDKYVVCKSRFTDNTVAFINRTDPLKRVFLTDKFFTTVFDQPYASSHPYLKSTVPPFEVNTHYRACFMLHEVSHQIVDTEDIIYLNPGFPYTDLLDEQTPYGRRLKDFTEIIQNCHSPYVGAESLFQQFDSNTQTWRDIPKGPAKQLVKKIAGASTLAQARLVFTHDPLKRVDLMLANADSLVLLITGLGREHPMSPGALMAM